MHRHTHTFIHTRTLSLSLSLALILSLASLSPLPYLFSLALPLNLHLICLFLSLYLSPLSRPTSLSLSLSLSLPLGRSRSLPFLPPARPSCGRSLSLFTLSLVIGLIHELNHGRRALFVQCPTAESQKPTVGFWDSSELCGISSRFSVLSHSRP